MKRACVRITQHAEDLQMAKHIGVRLPDDLIQLIEEGTTAVLATFSEKGIPHTTPVTTLYPKDKESIILTIYNEHAGYHNMAWQKKVMLSFMGRNNVAYSVLGRAGVVRAPSHIHPSMNVVRIDVIDIKADRYPLLTVDSGVRWSYTSAEAEDLGLALMRELKELAQTL
jgi:hypothetical protein